MEPAGEYGDDRGAARRAARDSMFLAATLTLDDRSPIAVRIRNLSASGMMAECAEMFAKGQRVTLDLRGVGEVAGSVAWSDGKRIGVAFDHLIDPQLTRRPVSAGHSAKAVVPPAPAYISGTVVRGNLFKSR
jgi:PilZ domain